MEAGGDVGGRDRLHQAGVVADRVGAERFTDVRVEVDAQRQQCTKQKGIALLRCPSAHWPGSPSKSRHLAAIRPAIRRNVGASLVPLEMSGKSAEFRRTAPTQLTNW